MSCVICQVPSVRGHMSGVMLSCKKKTIVKKDKVVEIVSGRSFIKRATPSVNIYDLNRL